MKSDDSVPIDLVHFLAEGRRLFCRSLPGLRGRIEVLF